MIRNLFEKFRKNELQKRISVYISDKLKRVIIAPKHINDAGIIYEQNNCFAYELPVTSEVLGEEVINCLNLFSLVDKNLRDMKQSDWPAYKHSKCKSIVSFQKEYIAINVGSVNDSNLVLEIVGLPHKDSDLAVKSLISFHADRTKIGDRILSVYNACLTGKII